MGKRMRDHDYLLLALEQAAKGLGDTWPNPQVGAVVVAESGVVGLGYHERAGEAHAEVNAIAAAGTCVGATIYVTLEPCCHYGRTPPCTEAIIAAGIARVVYAHCDINPQVAGQSRALLESHGIVVEQLTCEPIEAFYQAYDFWRLNQKPWVTAKLALSKNACVTDHQGGKVRITGDQANAYTHQQRRHADALMTSVATILADDPLLNARTMEAVVAKPIYVVDRLAQLPLQAHLWKTAASIDVFHAPNAPYDRLQSLHEHGAQVHCVNDTGDGLSWEEMLILIAGQGVQRLWLESGPRLALSAWRNDCCQEFIVFQSHTDIGGEPVLMPEALMTAPSNRLGNDIMLHWRQ